jgi:hypothetical protein
MSPSHQSEKFGMMSFDQLPTAGSIEVNVTTLQALKEARTCSVNELCVYYETKGFGNLASNVLAFLKAVEVDTRRFAVDGINAPIW